MSKIVPSKNDLAEKYEVTNPGDNQDNNANNDDTCVGICDEDTNDGSQSDESDPVFVLTIVMVLIFIAAITAIFVFKDNEIGKEPDHEEITDEFVPELPPLEPPKD